MFYDYLKYLPKSPSKALPWRASSWNYALKPLEQRAFWFCFQESRFYHTKSYFVFFESKIKSQIAVAHIIASTYPKTLHIPSLWKNRKQRTKLTAKYTTYFKICRKIFFNQTAPQKSKRCATIMIAHLGWFFNQILLEVSAQKSLKYLAVSSIVLKPRLKTA